MSFRFLMPVAGVIFLAGCMVGPKYKQPTAAVPPAYKELPETDQWKVAHPNTEALRSNWWEIFGDPQLNALEEQVAVSNQNLKVAEAQFDPVISATTSLRRTLTPVPGTNIAASCLPLAD